MTIRPSDFQAFIGQQRVLENLRVAVRSAKRQGRQLAHVLLGGPAGVGKTTLGMSVLPHELGASAVFVNCAAIEKPGQLVSVLIGIKAGQILFLDEIHALPPAAREHLLTALEDRRVTIMTGETAGVGTDQAMTIDLPDFTVVGATTRAGRLDAPTRSRFGHQLDLDFYTEDELRQICVWHAMQRHCRLGNDAATLLAGAAQGVARHAVNLVEHTIDTLYGRPQPPADGEGGCPDLEAGDAQETLVRLGFQFGLSPQQQRYILVLARGRKPRGVEALTHALGESAETIEQVIEPYLLRQGMIERGPQGRVLCEDKLPLGLALEDA